MTTPLELFQAGDPDGALELATAAVKNKPTDIAARSLLCEILCFSGDLERADRQLDSIVKIDPQAAPGVSLMRHLIRSEMSRQEVYEQGRVPDFLELPTESQQNRLQALLSVREGNGALAVEQLNAAAELDPDLTGSLNGNPFEGFCDMDDLLGSVMEVFTATGKYYWLNCDQIVSIDFEPVTHITDMLWRSASIETTGSVTGRVHIPAVYHGSARSDNPLVRIGRTTEWVQQDEQSPVRGAGRREFLIGDDPVSILEIRSLRFGQN
ncbi:MAG: tetratricopeptide repeat protein [Planctomycetaceae bacterium]|nr:tetratricopeptide repeat protein [Planctomycetaceae bacterium]MCA9066091.1 tetratricopeptide repeat protein [Planctomycetaceae bacterium]